MVIIIIIIIPQNSIRRWYKHLYNKLIKDD